MLLDQADAHVARDFPVALIELERELEIGLLVLRKADGIHAGVARAAVVRAAAADCRHEAFEAQIANAVGVEELPDILERLRRRDQLRAPRRVNAVEARRNR